MKICLWILALTLTIPCYAQSDLDLPIQRPVYDPNPEEPDPPPPPPPEPDPVEWLPSDEPPPVFFGEEIPVETETIFYVLDRSCSMMVAMPYRTPDSMLEDFGQKLSNGVRLPLAWHKRWDIAKMECLRSINGLSPRFKFNVIVYDCSVLQWQQTPQWANAANKQAITSWLVSGDGSHLGGGTGTGPAVVAALGWKENLAVALLTDGDPSCPKAVTRQPIDTYADHRRMIRVANTQGARIDVFYIYTGLPMPKIFCQNVAKENNGMFIEIHGD